MPNSIEYRHTYSINMKNLLVMYYASGKIKVEYMSAAEAIYLRSYSDIERVTILNCTDRVINNGL